MPDGEISDEGDVIFVREPVSGGELEVVEEQKVVGETFGEKANRLTLAPILR